MNTLLHALYDDRRQAEHAIARLAAAGIEPGAIQVIGMADSQAVGGHMGGFGDSGAHMHDAARDHVGGFGDSGAHMHDAARDHVGSFGDSGAHMHDAARDRMGSFADSSKGADMADDLARAGLSQAEAQAAAARLSNGATLLLVRAEGDTAARATEILRA
jgi:hypothetical protein